jgi:hypothetical protein
LKREFASGARWSDDATFLDRATPALHRSSPKAVAATMEPLDPSSMRVRIDAALPTAVRARGLITVPCTISNDGNVALVTGGTHPVFLCYRWYDENGCHTEVGSSLHTPLPAPLEPGASLEAIMPIAAPRYQGRYQLRVTLLQSEVAWFDDVAAENGRSAAVVVAETP